MKKVIEVSYKQLVIINIVARIMYENIKAVSDSDKIKRSILFDVMEILQKKEMKHRELKPPKIKLSLKYHEGVILKEKLMSVIEPKDDDETSVFAYNCVRLVIIKLGERGY